MPVTAPKCKLCKENHWSPVCPNIGKRGAVARVREIGKATAAKAAASPRAKPAPPKPKGRAAGGAPATKPMH